MLADRILPCPTIRNSPKSTKTNCMRKLSEQAQQELIDELLRQVADKENTFRVISDGRGASYSVNHEGEVYDFINADMVESYMKGYKGLVMEINDHGNVTVSKRFKNGNQREIASRV